MQLARGLWWILALVWIVMAFATKKVKRTETPFERVLHLVPLFIAFRLLFGRGQPFPWLFVPLLPNRPLLWWLGVAITALGHGDFHLGTSLSWHQLERHGHSQRRS